MPRRKRSACAGEHDRLAMIRIFDEGQDLARESQLPSGQNNGRITIVGAVSDEGARLVEVSPFQNPFIQVAVNDPVALFQKASRLRLIFFDHDSCYIRALELL